MAAGFLKFLFRNQWTLGNLFNFLKRALIGADHHVVWRLQSSIELCLMLSAWTASSVGGHESSAIGLID